jgi:hypothetical protein
MSRSTRTLMELIMVGVVAAIVAISGWASFNSISAAPIVSSQLSELGFVADNADPANTWVTQSGASISVLRWSQLAEPTETSTSLFTTPDGQKLVGVKLGQIRCEFGNNTSLIAPALEQARVAATANEIDLERLPPDQWLAVGDGLSCTNTSW